MEDLCFGESLFLRISALENLCFGLGFLPGAADHAGNLRSAHALTGSMFSLLVEIVKSMFLDHFGAQESAGVPDSESARGVLSRASLIFGFGWFPDHFGSAVNSPASRTLLLSQEKFLTPMVMTTRHP